ncbi:hypothetical protein FHT44_005037 [Mycolicibacterium sp. BK634]|uniref:hypothetical protein n=1 Tax=Mycolicibacterium sp. BK634 TaxID=2587099 RepID=UPI00161E0684|nr:hypothetical protein [Mycolicibacterium sp. BK634]MBB3752525.1 hypothetical protein [Mycolicibacterium sp. BK634]
MRPRIGTPEWVQDTARLIERKTTQTGEGFCEYEMPFIAGESKEYLYDRDGIAMSALGFVGENFGLAGNQAMSCDRCGGLFRDELWIMRRHRLECGW